MADVQKLYLIRHGKAEGQESDSPLSFEGKQDAEKLSNFLSDVCVDRIISSTYTRAYDSILPLSLKLGLFVEQDERLAEAKLSGTHFPDWLSMLEATFEQFDLCYVGGESSRQATNRAVSVVRSIVKSRLETTIVVTHGRLLTLLLRYFDSSYGFQEWRALTSPDVYLLTIERNSVPLVERIWQE